MKNYSLWNEYLKSRFKKLDKDISCDILIVGGGIAGVLTAFYLKNSKYKVVLVERNIIGSGITSKMTAKITFLQDILSKMNDDEKKLYLKSQIDGLNLLKENVNNYDIACDFEKNNSYLFTNQKSNINKLMKIKDILNKLNINCYEEEIPIPEVKQELSIKIDESYVINPIKYINEIVDLLNDINIYENTNIIETKKENNKYINKTIDNKIIKSKIVIYATNYPFFIKPLIFPIKSRLEKSYIAYGNSKYKDNYNLINIDNDVISIRFYKDKMIYLENSKYISHVNNRKDYNILLDNELIKNPEHIWSNIDIITNDNLPIVGEISKNMYLITGFNTWGILSSHIGANMISKMIKDNNKVFYQDLFDPKRTINLKKIINSSINILENINGYLKGIVYYNNKVCPHMKCPLIFNEVEQTWDCPCHGSRFDKKGEIINGPSKYNVK